MRINVCFGFLPGHMKAAQPSLDIFTMIGYLPYRTCRQKEKEREIERRRRKSREREEKAV